MTQLDDVYSMREDADVLLQQASSAQAALEPVRAEDASGQVSVNLDRDGDLTAVQVGFTWDRAIKVEQLPAAVIEAYAGAHTARLEQWAEAYQEVESRPAPRARPMDDSRSPVRAMRERLENADDPAEAAGRYAEEVLQEVVAGLEEANRILDEHAGRQYLARSAAGHVRAGVRGESDLVLVEYDVVWLRRAHPGNVGRETTQAIQAARRTAREQGVAAALRAGRLSMLMKELLPAGASPL